LQRTRNKEPYFDRGRLETSQRFKTQQAGNARDESHGAIIAETSVGERARTLNPLRMPPGTREFRRHAL
jgi:hypothetical protein